MNAFFVVCVYSGIKWLELFFLFFLLLLLYSPFQKFWNGEANSCTEGFCVWDRKMIMRRFFGIYI